MSEPKSPSTLLQFALQLAGVAAAEIMPRFQQVDVRMKADGTPVTEADTEAERVMRELISTRYPEHGIMGEEHPEKTSKSEYTWVLDPIDGTASFALGIPTFGTLVALLKNGHPIIGVINLPGLKETVYAELGYGCWFLNKSGELTRASVSKSDRLPEAYVSTTGVYCTDIDPTGAKAEFNMTALIRTSARFRFVGDCLQHALVARGLIDAAFDSEMHPWDNAAIIPCILEAGGIVSDGNGDLKNLVFAKSFLTASTAALHGEILESLKS